MTISPRAWAEVAGAVALLLTLAACGGASENRPRPASGEIPTEVAALPRTQIDQLVRQGEAALEQGLFDEAGANFSRVIEAQPGHPRAAFGYAEVMLALGRASEALAGFDAALMEPSLRPRALQGRGIAMLALNRRDGACDSLAEAVKIEPGLWRAWNGLGRCRDLAGDWPGAEAAYRRALEVRPDAAFVRNNLGFSLFLQGRYPESAAELKGALALDPGVAIARTNLRLALAAQGFYADATLDAAPTEIAETLNNAGFVAMLRGDYTQAEHLFARAMEASPTFNEAASRNLNHLNRLRRGEDAVRRQ